tara:strand:+ start:5251 stop:5721 length:471 start_codon:yes stop_codon:yes gene_type:complete
MTRRFYANTWFIDIDGTIFIHLENNDGIQKDEILKGTKEFWSKIPDDDCIVLTTGRPSWWRVDTVLALEKFNLRYDVLLMDLPSGRRVLINDMKPKGSSYGNDVPVPTAFARNVERNKGVDWNSMEMDNVISPQDTVIVKQPNEKVYYFDKETYYS